MASDCSIAYIVPVFLISLLSFHSRIQVNKNTNQHQSSTCIPATNLLSPLKHPICPLLSERYELRTRALGCGCSTTTFLSIIITILCTLFATLLIYSIWKAQILQWLWRIFGPGAWEGWERVEVEEGGEVAVREGAWRRGGKGGK